MNQKDRNIKKFNSNLFLSKINSQKVKKELKIKILNCYNKRCYNKLSAKDVAISISVSESTIKRLENGLIYDISVIYNYIDLLKDLPDRKKKIIPKWVYADC